MGAGWSAHGKGSGRRLSKYHDGAVRFICSTFKLTLPSLHNSTALGVSESRRKKRGEEMNSTIDSVFATVNGALTPNSPRNVHLPVLAIAVDVSRQEIFVAVGARVYHLQTGNGSSESSSTTVIGEFREWEGENAFRRQTAVVTYLLLDSAPSVNPGNTNVGYDANETYNNEDTDEEVVYTAGGLDCAVHVFKRYGSYASSDSGERKMAQDRICLRVLRHSAPVTAMCLCPQKPVKKMSSHDGETNEFESVSPGQAHFLKQSTTLVVGLASGSFVLWSNHGKLKLAVFSTQDSVAKPLSMSSSRDDSNGGTSGSISSATSISCTRDASLLIAGFEDGSCRLWTNKYRNDGDTQSVSNANSASDISISIDIPKPSAYLNDRASQKRRYGSMYNNCFNDSGVVGVFDLYFDERPEQRQDKLTDDKNKRNKSVNVTTLSSIVTHIMLVCVHRDGMLRIWKVRFTRQIQRYDSMHFQSSNNLNHSGTYEFELRVSRRLTPKFDPLKSSGANKSDSNESILARSIRSSLMVMSNEVNRQTKDYPSRQSLKSNAMLFVSTAAIGKGNPCVFAYRIFLRRKGRLSLVPIVRASHVYSGAGGFAMASGDDYLFVGGINGIVQAHMDSHLRRRRKLQRRRKPPIHGRRRSNAAGGARAEMDHEDISETVEDMADIIENNSNTTTSDHNSEDQDWNQEDENVEDDDLSLDDTLSTDDQMSIHDSESAECFDETHLPPSSSITTTTTTTTTTTMPPLIEFDTTPMNNSSGYISDMNYGLGKSGYSGDNSSAGDPFVSVSSIYICGRDCDSNPDDDDDGPHSFQCPITLELMSDPVILAGDGISYERDAIETWLSSNNNQTSPATNVMLASGEARRLISNVSLRNAIQEWKLAQS